MNGVTCLLLRHQLWIVFLLLIVGVTLCSGRSGGKGVLRVRITNFQNPLNKDAEGDCCMSFRRSPTCRGNCRTFFRVCATHSPRPLIIFPESTRISNVSSSLSSLIASRRYSRSKSGLVAPPPRALKLRSRGRGQRWMRTRAMRSRSRGINSNVPCTLGLLVTEVVVNSSLNAAKEGALDITFPFSTLWPINFKLIVEAWHDVTGQLFKTQEALRIDKRVGKLIMRHVSRHTVEAGEDWSHFAYRPSHTQLNYSLRVNCASPYYGKKCAKSCEDLGDKNSHYICDESGEIRCLAGWSGVKCDIPKCLEGCNPVHGFCTKPGECRCAVGWRGEKCDECTPLPGCQHGYCNSSSFECICEEGWDGLFCSQPSCLDGCHITRGYCERPGECKCRIGWGGPTCEECKPLPGCIHGNCTKPLECRCEPGWTGLFCQTPVCGLNCNKDHGSCTKPGECRCDVGWWGDNCDMCFPYPGCQNGFCREPWQCVCEPGWKGMLCDEPDDEAGRCRNNPGACLNGGTCIDVQSSGNFTCSCPSLFTGQRCDYLAEVISEESVSDLDLLEPTNSPSQIQVVTADGLTLAGTFSSNQSSERSDGSRRELSKDERRALLQSTARIFFRQPKLVSKEKDQSENPPFKVIERKLLPLPVFLPRVSEIIPGEEGPTRILKSVTKQPTPILVLESRSDTENVVYKDTVVPEVPESPRKNQIDENRRFLRHQQGSPDFLPELEEAAATERARNQQSLRQHQGRPDFLPELQEAAATERARSQQSLRHQQGRPDFLPELQEAAATERARSQQSLRQQQGRPDFLPELQEAVGRERSINQQTLNLPNKRIVKVTSLGEQPLQISAHASALPRPNPVNPATLRTRPFPSQHTGATNRQGVTPPTTLPAPLIRRQSTGTSVTSATTSLPKGSPQVLHAQSRSSIWLPSDPISEEDDVIAEGSEGIQTYYEENSNGRVHIGDVRGVDDAAPHEEIYEAFIELKKV